MKNKFSTVIFLSLFIAVSFIACGPDNEDPKPPADKPPVNTVDTAALFQEKNWVIRKYARNGVNDPGSFLIGCSYSIYNDGNYTFNIPGYPSAIGTWEFSASAKTKVNFYNQGAGFKWTIISIDSTNLVVEERDNSGTDVERLEMSL